MAKSLYPDNIPNWSGWNSKHDYDVNPKQVVGYLKPIQLPPTRTDVVKETLNRVQKLQLNVEMNMHLSPMISLLLK